MKLTKCEKGHFYDKERYGICPHCCDEKITKGGVRPASEGKDGDGGTVLLEAENQGTVLLEDAGGETKSEGTVLLEEGSSQENKEEAADHPCIAPPEKKEDSAQWRIHAGNRCMNCMKEFDICYEVCPVCGFVRGSVPKEVYHLYPGMKLSDRYIIGTVLGFGGFGITYRAWDILLEAMVAIKEYYPAGIVNRIPGEKEVILYTGKGLKEFGNGLSRFLEEARNTAKFSNHPNIVNVFDFFEENGTAYIVMEFLDGISLKEYLKREGGRLDCDAAVSIIGFVVEALKQIHSVGIIHRDISPDNIFVCSDGRIKLIDFGAARFSAGEEKTLSIVLKMGFAPPEQYRSRSRQGPFTDIYALAATMYRMITGVVPEESVNRVEEDTLKSPGELVSNVPEHLNHALMKAMALNPELRFQNMEQFWDAVQNKKKVLELEEELKRRKKFRVAGIGAAVCILVVAFSVSFGMYNQRKTEAVLEEAVVTVWAPLDEGQTEEEKKTVLLDMAEEFMAAYPYITLDITCIPEDQYSSQLAEALEGNRLAPVLFESGGLDKRYNEKMADVKGALELLDLDSYYFLDQYQQYFPDGKQLPLGFGLGVLYANTSLEAGGSPIAEENDREGFIGGKEALFVGGTEEFYEVQEALPGVYSMMPLPSGRQMGNFDQIFSVNEAASEAEKLAAVRLLYYFLGQNAQDVLHIGNDNAIPLNKELYEVYLEVNQEFSFLGNELKDVLFLSQEEAEQGFQAAYREISQNQEEAWSYIQDWEEK